MENEFYMNKRLIKNISYSIFKNKYSFDIPAGFIVEISRNKPLKIKGNLFRMVRVRSIINPNNIMIVSAIAGEKIPITETVYEKLLFLIKKDFLSKYEVALK